LFENIRHPRDRLRGDGFIGAGCLHWDDGAGPKGEGRYLQKALWCQSQSPHNIIVVTSEV
jgi:hypothetical protein